MDIYLAAFATQGNASKEYYTNRPYNWVNLNILESYYGLKNDDRFPPIIKDMGNFMLDSGAFTYMTGTGGQTNFEKYIEEYAAFINKWNVDKFFELDIDSIVGLNEVERLRLKLERLTGKQPIPVWHKSRGKEYFIKMCEQYPYVALGGIVTKEIPTQLYEKLFPWFISTAHKNGCKIHGLGYTRITNLSKFKFDSVDSTAWIYGNMSASVYLFNPSTGLIDKIKAPQGKRLKSGQVAIHNFNEWVKFQKYAKNNL